MDLEQINAILDAALAYIEKAEKEKTFLLQLVANRDKVIERLQDQLTTCATVLSASDEESAVLHGKLSELWGVLLADTPPK